MVVAEIVSGALAGALLLAAFASWLLASAQPLCQFTLPAYGQPDQHCTTFDLSGIAHMATLNIRTVGWQGGGTCSLFVTPSCSTLSWSCATSRSHHQHTSCVLSQTVLPQTACTNKIWNPDNHDITLIQCVNNKLLSVVPGTHKGKERSPVHTACIKMC